MSVSDSGFRLAIATCAQFPAVYPDDAYFVSVLERLGVQPVICVWNDPSVDWAAFDAVLIRTIWDYFQHYTAFLAWLDTLDQLGVPAINDTQLIRWNSDKRYLFDIEQQGVPIIPTRMAAAGCLPEMFASATEGYIVIKPSVSGGAWHTVRGRPGSTVFESAVAALPDHLDFLIQPFVPEIATHGEWSLLYFAGRYSHAVIKRPAPGDYRVQEQHGGIATLAIPDAAIVQAADRALAAVAALGYREQAYARVDGVMVGDQFRIMELELVEPLLHLAIRPEAAERFAGHVMATLQVLSRDNVMAH
jgi:glutathione synthase/RimK-type ligase-like ATP-grasp enzyme